MNRDSEPDLTPAQDRIRLLEAKLCEADQELKAASEIIDEQDFNIECLGSNWRRLTCRLTKRQRHVGSWNAESPTWRTKTTILAP